MWDFLVTEKKRKWQWNNADREHNRITLRCNSSGYLDFERYNKMDSILSFKDKIVAQLGELFDKVNVNLPQAPNLGGQQGTGTSGQQAAGVQAAYNGSEMTSGATAGYQSTTGGYQSIHGAAYSSGTSSTTSATSGYQSGATGGGYQSSAGGYPSGTTAAGAGYQSSTTTTAGYQSGTTGYQSSTAGYQSGTAGAYQSGTTGGYQSQSSAAGYGQNQYSGAIQPAAVSQQATTYQQKAYTGQQSADAYHRQGSTKGYDQSTGAIPTQQQSDKYSKAYQQSQGYQQQQQSDRYSQQQDPYQSQKSSSGGSYDSYQRSYSSGSAGSYQQDSGYQRSDSRESQRSHHSERGDSRGYQDSSSSRGYSSSERPSSRGERDYQSSPSRYSSSSSARGYQDQGGYDQTSRDYSRQGSGSHYSQGSSGGYYREGSARSDYHSTSGGRGSYNNKVDSSWLRQFRAMCKLDAVQFADIWTLYDQDGESFPEPFPVFVSAKILKASFESLKHATVPGRSVFALSTNFKRMQSFGLNKREHVIEWKVVYRRGKHLSSGWKEPSFHAENLLKSIKAEKKQNAKQSLSKKPKWKWNLVKSFLMVDHGWKFLT